MHFYQFFSIAAIVSIAATLPTQTSPLEILDLKALPDAQTSPNLSLGDNILKRDTPDSTSITVSDVIPFPKRKTLFTITLHGTRVAFNGAIKYTTYAYLNNDHRVYTFHSAMDASGTDKGAIEILKDYEWKKNWWNKEWTRISTNVEFFFETAAGTVYKFLAEVMYGIATDISGGYQLQSVELCDITEATQRVAGGREVVLPKSAYDIDYKGV